MNSKIEDIKEAIKEYIEEKYIDTIYRCYEARVPYEEIHIRCREATWNTDSAHLKRRVMDFKRWGGNLDDIFPITIRPPTIQYLKIPKTLNSEVELVDYFENYDGSDLIGKAISEVQELEYNRKKIWEMYKLWQTGTVFEGFHKGYSLEENLVFYLEKLENMVGHKCLNIEKILTKIFK